jgi:hypothetical protein
MLISYKPTPNRSKRIGENETIYHNSKNQCLKLFSCRKYSKIKDYLKIESSPRYLKLDLHNAGGFPPPRPEMLRFGRSLLLQHDSKGCLEVG